MHPFGKRRDDASAHKHTYPFIHDITTRVPLRLLIYRRVPPEDETMIYVLVRSRFSRCARRVYTIYMKYRDVR